MSTAMKSWRFAVSAAFFLSGAYPAIAQHIPHPDTESGFRIPVLKHHVPLLKRDAAETSSPPETSPTPRPSGVIATHSEYPPLPELSLMFNHQEIAQLKRALQEYFRRQEEDTEEELMPPPPPPVVAAPVQEAPTVLDTGDLNFSLSSVLYYSPRHWSVWVNGTRITRQENPFIFQLGAIRKNSVELLFDINDLDALIPNWAVLYKKHQRKNPRYVRYVRADRQANALRVRLQPNQSFVLAKLAIVEGKRTYRPSTDFSQRLSQGGGTIDTPLPPPPSTISPGTTIIEEVIDTVRQHLPGQ